MEQAQISPVPAPKNKLTSAKEAVSAYYSKSAPREKMIIQATLVLLVAYIIYQAAVPIRDEFRRQSAEQASAQRDMELVPAALKKYLTLKARQASVERAYHEVELKEGAITVLESLIRDRAGIPSGSFTIREGRASEAVGGYEQSMFNVKFTITDYPRLVEFLKELTQGSKPMILAGIDLKKRPAGDALDVDMDVISMRRAQKPGST